ncbi:hypothetical protein IP92_01310 [Pseudoduganella flava]|uniref:Uncharacterized protein n=1 Tax=Pseudoduganella flava TaxID=871742 RepID=A0A562Q0C6_9BURK|nr:hypothetical protein [Pseudoduganella flava]QGZ38372.1 hypothetical protein GO485_04435 [Pseudoduganella flava]TWI50083.1 hypothetical protein IP92_01310 [Pseudoduganella flava]
MANLSLYDAPAQSARPLFMLRDGADRPLVFLVDAAGRLHLLRRVGDNAWSVLELTEALPGGADRVVCCADVRQAPDGSIAVAIATTGKNATGPCTLHVASGLPAGLNDSQWQEALRNLAPLPELPQAARVTRLAFGPLQVGAPPLLLVSAVISERPATWYCNAASPDCGLRALALPANVAGAQAYAVGTYRLPGVWALHPGGRDGELRFASFGDAFGWKVEMAYPNLPPRTGSVYLAPGLVPNVPDLFAAGERIVVYRGSNHIPQPVAQVAGARLLWSTLNEGGEYLAYADAAGALWLVSRPARGAWGEPYRLTERRAVLAAGADGTAHAVALDGDGTLFLQHVDVHGKRLGQETVHLPPM